MLKEIKEESNPDGVVVVMTGTVTGGDIIAVNKEIAENKKYTFQLWDLTKVDSLNATPDEMHVIALQDCSIPKVSKLGKVALVGSKETFQTMDEAYHVYSSKWIGKTKEFLSQTFQSIEETRSWIANEIKK